MKCIIENKRESRDKRENSEVDKRNDEMKDMVNIAVLAKLKIYSE